MIIQIFDDERQVAKAGASLIAAQLLHEPESVLGFATGSTPLGVYAELIKLYQTGIISFYSATTFNLDEYYGIKRSHKESYYSFMMDKLFGQVNLPEKSIHIPNGEAVDPEKECSGYEDSISIAGGIDLQLLGIGRNGHIGFNEPAGHFVARTHLVNLSDDTIDANSRFFASADEVPRQALSMGIGTIMDAYKILMVATGTNKAAAVRDMIKGNIDPQCQASILQVHPRVTVLLDKEAASLL